MRIAVIGCGYWGSKHVRVLSSLPDVDLVVAVDRDTDRTAALVRQYPGVLPARDISEVLELVDAAIIATPPRTHAPLARDLLLAGKHVLVEKPMATSIVEAEELVEMSDALGLVLMAGHTFAYNPAVQHLRRMVEEQAFGQVYHVDAARLNLGLYQSDVNCIWDLAPHDVSILNYLLGSEPTLVSAWGSRHAGSSFEDIAYVRLEYADVGASAQVHVSWLDPCKVRRVTVVGRDCMAVYNDLHADEAVRVYDRGVVSPVEADANVPMSYRNGDIHLPRIAWQEPLRVEDQHFVDCVSRGAVCRTDGRVGLGVVKVLEAADVSLRSGGRPVAVTPTERVIHLPEQVGERQVLGA